MGFFNTVLDRLPEPKLRGHIEGLVEKRLAQALRES
jgi:hypothetical protein